MLKEIAGGRETGKAGMDPDLEKEMGRTWK